MKKLVIILFVMIPLFGNAQFFDYSASIETGYYTGTRLMTQAKEYEIQCYYEHNVISRDSIYTIHPKMSFYSDLQFGLHFFDHRLNFKTDVITTFTKNSVPLNFTPLFAVYKTNLYYDFQNIPLKAGWKHSCSHTVENRVFERTNYNAAYNKFYIKLKIK